MWEFFERLFDTANFPARWTCGQWSAGHGWLHIVSDLAVFGAYVAIPAVIFVFVRKRKDIRFPKVVWLFGAFILSCGLTHLIDATIFWHPWYRFSGIMKAVTATVSWATVVAIVLILPAALRLPSLVSINRRLEREVEQRREAEAVSQKVARDMENLLYVVSHDLKSPLVTIEGFSSLLGRRLESGDSEGAIDDVARIHRGARTMGRLIDGILELTRVHASPDGVRPVDVTDVVDEVRHVHTSAIEAKKATIVVAPGTGTVVADRTLFLRSILNLVDNALKYGCPEPESTITIGSTRAGGEGRVFVSDQGPGIAPDHHDRVFEMFQRVDREREGTGLGLATVARVAELHGGRAWVESRVEGGATFWMAFPDVAVTPSPEEVIADVELAHPVGGG